MKRLTVLIVLLICIVSLWGQSIIIEGKQVIVAKSSNPELSCTPVKITKSMKITEVEGNCKGFWIQKGSITVHKFTNLTDPIGTVLKPGIYYVYPYVKKGEKLADVKVTIETAVKAT